MHRNGSLSLSIDCGGVNEVTIAHSRHNLYFISFFSLLLLFGFLALIIISNDFSLRHINMYQTSRQIQRICRFCEITRTTLCLKPDHLPLLNLPKRIVIFIIKIIRVAFASARSGRPH